MRAYQQRCSDGRAIIRVTEGFIYNDAMAAVEPRLEELSDVIRLIVD